MTPAQIVLLKMVINADRRYWDSASRIRDDRGVEVGWINGVSPKTAHALAGYGLIEVREGRAYLGTFDPYGVIEEKP